MKVLLISVVLMGAAALANAQSHTAPSKQVEALYTKFQQKSAAYAALLENFNNKNAKGTVEVADVCAASSAGSDVAGVMKRLLDQMQLEQPKKDWTSFNVRLYQLTAEADGLQDKCKALSVMQSITR